jgi:Tol biopolymer transport system component
MVGRLREGQLMALGAESAVEWNAALEGAAAGLGLKVAANGDGYGPSDQTSFYAARVPVLHFFTGAHEQYHTPDDDPATLNAEGAARVAELTAPVQAGDSRGYGAYLGTVPDYRALGDATGGVLLADVRAGGPAEQAGVKAGDRLVELAGTRLDNLYDMTFALQDHKPGETVDVVVLRGSESLRLRATLGSRSEAGRGPAGPAPAVGPSASPPAPSAPPDPHATQPAAAPALPDFYRERPGRDFVVRAGRPFEKTFEGERHLKDVRQLTFGGENAEAYFSPDGTRLIYQWTPPGAGCDQQYLLDLASGDVRRVSSGRGRTTCGYFDYPEADRIVYASTEAAGEACPPAPDRSQGYVWPIYAGYDLFEAGPDGSGARRLTETAGYDAEATWCQRGGKLVFTSVRDGDLELYEMDEAGDVRRLTHSPGYDGGAFYSPDCSEIVFRGFHPEGAQLEEYRRLLAQGLVRPTVMELFVMNADGAHVRQLTRTGKANFCPYFHPDGRRIVYSSNALTESGREFDLFLIGKEGGEPERVTYAPGFDGFPIWSPDGEWLVFASNRAQPEGRETNLFIARWVE